MPAINRRWCLGDVEPNADLASLSLTQEHYVYDEEPAPSIEQGQILIQSHYFSPDPMNHAWARGLNGRFSPIPSGAPHRGGTAGVVVASKHPRFQEGDRITGFLEWADFNVSDGTDQLNASLYKVPPDIPLASGLGALGMTGLCGWLGMTDIGRPLPGDTVVVSGASGAIGSIAGQIAKLAGATVIGMARGEAKCQFVGSLGFDAVVDQSRNDWAEQLDTLCPAGIHVFFDNVGGAVLDNLLPRMVRGGRIVVCGATAHYTGEAGITNHLMLAIRGCTMKGFFYFDYAHAWSEARERMADLLRRGLIQDTLDITDGFDLVPSAALGQFQSANFGRKLVSVNDRPDN